MSAGDRGAVGGGPRRVERAAEDLAYAHTRHSGVYRSCNMGQLAREKLLCRAGWSVAAAREKGVGREVRHLPGGAGCGAMLRLDRRAEARRERPHVAAAIRSANEAERLVQGE